jgi:hypothetical protein
LLREPIAREAASVFARPRKRGDEDDVGADTGDPGEDREKAGWEGDRFAERSEPCERERDVMGTVRLLIFEFELRGFQSALRLLFGCGGSSGGISSAAGKGRPLTTAIN